MKKIIKLFLLLVVIAGMSSCSNDDGGVSSAKLIGTWREIYYEEWYKEDGELVDNIQKDYSTSKYATVVTFYEDGTLKHRSAGYSTYYWGTWAIKGNKFYFSLHGQYDTSDIDDVYHIATLNSTTLVVEFGPYTEREDGITYQGYEKTIYERVEDE